MAGRMEEAASISFELPEVTRPVEGEKEARGGPTDHTHRSAPADRRVWLEAIPDQAATMSLHSFCVDCGAVRSERLVRGRPLGFFERALANLKAVLEDDPRHPKLAQVHSRLIALALASIPDFGDPYTMPFEVQWAIFVDAVQRHRPDLDVDFVRSALPRLPRRSRPAYIDLIATEPREVKDTPVRR